jgi:hypothetical protein
MSSIQATEADTTKLLEMLVGISSQQESICKMLDDMLQLLNTPSDDVLNVLARLLAPMGRDMDELTERLKVELTRRE